MAVLCFDKSHVLAAHEHVDASFKMTMLQLVDRTGLRGLVASAKAVDISFKIQVL